MTFFCVRILDIRMFEVSSLEALLYKFRQGRNEEEYSGDLACS